ncbi:dihydrolipoamide dehydrogenase [Sporobacter termitidis DSM 10068]|uniref:Dihydrolipoyl dehydrogenase n=1 Tax=Sporobacter termitidis DSM 10068 TaxID=1123282 RepID=A0A1M5YQQ2_9FIRM|nr:dihydrolipoyl dehydrogenase [Sporobacter termitidis]SHI14415.1 dihydrolipoamide dehydrogenase [Sporobacter termitidis DSM 10068]
MGKRIVVIGGGPGGYAAAIKAAQLGAQVTLAEAAQVGGTCLNVGCIPTKALLHTGEFYRKVAMNAVAGVKTVGAFLDWPAVQQHKEKIVGKLTGGVAALLRHNGVKVISESASLLPDRKVRIGNEILETDAVILATGSVNTDLRFPGSDLYGVIDSTKALSLDEVPKSMVIVGGGVIGVEFATLFNAVGTKVSIIELLPEILPPVDVEIAGFLHETLMENGVQLYTGAKLTGVEKSEDVLTVGFEQNGETRQVTAEKVLVAVGRRPRTAGLGLEALGIKLTRGAIDVDDYFRTNAPAVYAVGDCNGRIMLAHAAMAQGVAAAEHIMGAKPHYDPKIVPSCVYSSPEIACVGMTEKQAKESGIDYSVGSFNLGGNGKSLIDDAGGGYIKIIADKTLGEVLGIHMIGSRVTEIIAEAALCMNMEGTVEDIVNTVHAHPTVSEAVCEAAMSVFGKSIHGV